MSIKKETQREKLIKRVREIKVKLGNEDLILSDPEVEFLDRIMWSVQEFFSLVS